MSRKVVATPLFVHRLQAFLDEYAQIGAIRFVECMQHSYRGMIENIATFNEIAPARRRRVQGKKITVREYVLDAGARDFLVLYYVPPNASDPVVLLNIRIGGQHHFQWQN
ncbi:MAG: hypothetical protein JXR59_03000 [Desulfuromonadaceae bacterium]|nr:hypothetical protein [Desulfuromonadaceae bacterium]